MKEPVLVLSDLHLGHRVSRVACVEDLRGLMAGMGTVVLNGDTWQELALRFRERSDVMLAELRGLGEEMGVELVFLAGNHDPGLGESWLELAEGRILVTHGDALFAEGSPWSREALMRKEVIRELWEKHQGADEDVKERMRLAREMAHALRCVVYPKGRTLWRRVWDAMWPPERAWQMLRVWALQAVVAAGFAGRFFPRAEVVLIGHFHRSGAWVAGGRRVINTGSYMNPGKALWVEYDAGWLRCGVVDESVTPYRRGEVLGCWRFPRLAGAQDGERRSQEMCGV